MERLEKQIFFFFYVAQFSRRHRKMSLVHVCWPIVCVYILALLPEQRATLSLNTIYLREVRVVWRVVVVHTLRMRYIEKCWTQNESRTDGGKTKKLKGNRSSVRRQYPSRSNVMLFHSRWAIDIERNRAHYHQSIRNLQVVAVNLNHHILNYSNDAVVKHVIIVLRPDVFVD